ncbi:hypothetical protein OAD24_11915 [Pseudomonadales bacterium]|nr:hypothetical protein [Pseudomonadales bacterium]|tara:strand:+ start:124 stop:312 length:189 start_codon:yes stop_codon:yes gene_type:complete
MTYPIDEYNGRSHHWQTHQCAAKNPNCFMADLGLARKILADDGFDAQAMLIKTSKNTTGSAI